MEWCLEKHAALALCMHRGFNPEWTQNPATIVAG